MGREIRFSCDKCGKNIEKSVDAFIVSLRNGRIEIEEYILCSSCTELFYRWWKK